MSSRLPFPGRVGPADHSWSLPIWTGLWFFGSMSYLFCSSNANSGGASLLRGRNCLLVHGLSSEQHCSEITKEKVSGELVDMQDIALDAVLSVSIWQRWVHSTDQHFLKLRQINMPDFLETASLTNQLGCLSGEGRSGNRRRKLFLFRMNAMIKDYVFQTTAPPYFW